MFSCFRKTRKSTPVTAPILNETIPSSMANTKKSPAESLPDFLLVDNSNAPPINRISIDLLQNIFLLCLWPNDTYDRSVLYDHLRRGSDFITPSSTKAPLVLCIICRHWRNVALSTPLLWNNLKIPIVKEYRYLPSLELAGVWLSRSGTAPLSLDLTKGPEDIKQPFLRFLSLIHSHCHHLHRLDVYSSAAISIDDLLIPPLTPPSTLTSFTVILPTITNPCNTGIKAWIELMLSSPVLNSLFLWAANITISEFSIPFAKLTSLILVLKVTAQEALQILQASPQLTHFSLRSSELGNVDVVAAGTLPHCIHTSLLELSITVSSEKSGIPYVLDNLTTPSLLQLKINGGCRPIISLDFKTDFNALPFLARSSPPLERLTLIETRIPSEELFGCMQVVSPTLRRLWVEEERYSSNCIRDDILIRMTAEPGILPLCPRLEVLHFIRAVHCSDGYLGAMVQSRMPTFPDGDSGVATLLAIQLKELPEENLKDREVLNAIKESRGTNFHLVIIEKLPSVHWPWFSWEHPWAYSGDEDSD